VTVTDRDALNPVVVGAHMLRAIYARHPRAFEWNASIDRLFGGTRLRDAVSREGGIEALLPELEVESRAFADSTRRYWLYH
jgi:hypothetical protein